MPLEHYLYAGRDTFKIVDASRNWVARGYHDNRLDIALPDATTLGTRMLAMLSEGNRTRNEKLQVYLLYSVSVLEALQEVCSVAQHQHAVVNAAQPRVGPHPAGVAADSPGPFTLVQTRISTCTY